MTKTLATTQSIKGVLAKKDSTLTDLLVHVGPEAENPPEVETPLPKSPALPVKIAKVVAALPARLASIIVPDERRELAEDELRELTVALDEVKKAKAAVTTAEGNFKAAFFNHFDAVARKLGRVTEDTKRTKDGWLVLADTQSASVEGLEKKVTRETSSGSANLSVEALQELEEEGVITHREFLEFTAPVRVLDEAAIMRAVADDPDLGLKLAEKVTVTGANASLHLRANRL